ncbi:MAG TPA: BON domain-containing protein [Longimicrobiaceae bacterium]|nr:BON domain-containing protein [Longimicrobiaceae bacterium]
MATDFSNLHDFSTMTDDEVYDVVVEALREYPNLDLGWIDVAVRDGHVTLSGRVATDGELQVAEKVVLDILGIEHFTNELVVDELHRDTAPEAADEAAALDAEVDDQLGAPAPDQSDTAEHLVEDLDAATFGTHNPQQAMMDGTSYSPPDRPIPDGYLSHEDH